jgi:hypothetical protein
VRLNLLDLWRSLINISNKSNHLKEEIRYIRDRSTRIYIVSFTSWHSSLNLCLSIFSHILTLQINSIEPGPEWIMSFKPKRYQWSFWSCIIPVTWYLTNTPTWDWTCLTCDDVWLIILKFLTYIRISKIKSYNMSQC